jgi:hypothetical protein
MPLLRPEYSFHSDNGFSVPLTITSSTKVFHSSHEGHLPTHFALSCPQLLQKKAVLVLLIKNVFMKKIDGIDHEDLNKQQDYKNVLLKIKTILPTFLK